MIDIPTIAVPIKTDEDGVIRVGGTRVTLDVLIARHQQGKTPEAIHASFPTVPLADVYAVISYYLSHQDEVDAYMQRNDVEAERIRREWESKQPESFVMQAKMRALLAVS